MVPIAAGLVSKIVYGKRLRFSHLLSAVARAVQDAEISAPRADGTTILVSHDAGKLMQMREVVHGPSRKKFG